MASDLADIMEALGKRIDTVDGLRGYGYAPDGLPVPCAFPLVPAIPSYQLAMKRGTYQLAFSVVVLTSAQLDRVGQPALARFANPTGPQSIRAALADGDRTLGGLINDLVVDSFDPDGLEQLGYGAYYGGAFSVRVYASGV
ncbi:hypothetical protein [Micromonospora sp. WMMD1082]|uniref:hypothetical protein n=1 Tax=Micromonospora sp. WMMD1082 TaxID=3016104 RepID=UPI00241687EE|nr:hypothetical protein [Micromonospora sp. WMMD1082]MDG4796212.1 hypothetical protein [Micromonospora sp. WMMD1082]